jgi:hypothetical protein
MDTIFDDPSPEALVGAIEKNLYDVYFAFAQKRVRHVEADVSWVNSSPAAWPSYVFRTDFPEEQAGQRVQEVIQQMERGEAPPMWMIGPSAHPEYMNEIICKHGFTEMGCALGMAVHLAEMCDDFSMPVGLEIVRVDDPKTLYAWVTTFVTGMFEGSEADAKEFYELVTELELPADARFYLGIYEGQPAATSMLFPSSGIAGVYHVTCLPAYRNKGIGRQITLAPLLDAREKGYRVAILQSSFLGEVIYKKIGFKEYCKIHEYGMESCMGAQE